MFKITGFIQEITKEKRITPRLNKRTFVLETESNSRYPQLMQFETINARNALLDEFNVGDEVESTFQLRGRKWTSPSGQTKFFSTLACIGLRLLKSRDDGTFVEHEEVAENKFDDDLIPF